MNMVIWYQLKPSNIKVMNLTRLNFAAVHLVFQYFIIIYKDPAWRMLMGLWQQSHPGTDISFSPERSRTYLPPTTSPPKFSVPPGTGDRSLVTTKSSWDCWGNRTAQVTPGADFLEAPQGLKSILQAKLQILLERCWFPEGMGWFCFNQAPNKHWQTKQIKHITSSQFQIIPQQESAALTGFVLCFIRGQKVIALCNSAFN